MFVAIVPITLSQVASSFNEGYAFVSLSLFVCKIFITSSLLTGSITASLLAESQAGGI